MRIVVSGGGAVLLLLLWCLVVDVLIARLTGGGIYIQGYVDNICLQVVGRFLNILELMQWALHTVETRCNDVQFSVYLDKTELVLTVRRKLSGFFVSHFFGVPLSHSMSVKDPGVVPDSQLTWREHVDAKVRKAHSLLWACVTIWGLTPKVVHWLHNSIICPSITFAS